MNKLLNDFLFIVWFKALINKSGDKIENKLHRNSDIRNNRQYEYFDTNIKGLITFLFNEFPKVKTLASCGGHINPNDIQKPQNEWFIGFHVYKDRWDLFELFCRIVNEINKSLQKSSVIIKPGEYRYHFYLTGKNIEPDKFLQLLKKRRRY